MFEKVIFIPLLFMQSKQQFPGISISFFPSRKPAMFRQISIRTRSRLAFHAYIECFPSNSTETDGKLFSVSTSKVIMYLPLGNSLKCDELSISLPSIYNFIFPVDLHSIRAIRKESSHLSGKKFCTQEHKIYPDSRHLHNVYRVKPSSGNEYSIWRTIGSPVRDHSRP